MIVKSIYGLAHQTLATQCYVPIVLAKLCQGNDSIYFGSNIYYKDTSKDTYQTTQYYNVHVSGFAYRQDASALVSIIANGSWAKSQSCTLSFDALLTQWRRIAKAKSE